MSSATSRNPAEEIKYWLSYIDCATTHPHPLPTGKHVYRANLEAVPEVRDIYHCLYKLYTEEPSSVNFREPVNALQLGVFGYYDVVRTPMSLRTVLDNIAEGEYYSSAKQVMHDVDAVWKNCETFNGATSPVTAEARKCATALERIRQAFRDEQLAPEEEVTTMVNIIENSIENQDMTAALWDYFRREDPGMMDGDVLAVEKLKVKHITAMRAIVDRFTA